MNGSPTERRGFRDGGGPDEYRPRKGSPRLQKKFRNSPPRRKESYYLNKSNANRNPYGGASSKQLLIEPLVTGANAEVLGERGGSSGHTGSQNTGSSQNPPLDGANAVDNDNPNQAVDGNHVQRQENGSPQGRLGGLGGLRGNRERDRRGGSDPSQPSDDSGDESSHDRDRRDYRRGGRRGARRGDRGDRSPPRFPGLAIERMPNGQPYLTPPNSSLWNPDQFTARLQLIFPAEPVELADPNGIHGFHVHLPYPWNVDVVPLPEGHQTAGIS